MSTEKKPRNIDPEIQRLRDAHRAAVAALEANRKSAALLARITADVVKLTPEDKSTLTSLLVKAELKPAPEAQ